MTHILTLVASDLPLNDHHIAIAQDFTGESGATDWLHQGHAVDLPLSRDLDKTELEDLRAKLAKDRIDLFLSPQENRRKKLFLADMDSTIVDGETLDDVAAHAGVQNQVAAITEQAMNGELNYAESLRARVQLIKNLPESTLKETLDQTGFNTGAETVLKTLNAHKIPSVLVSSGFTYFTHSVAAQLGFSHYHGNVLHLENGVVTGEVQEPILDANSKLNFLHEYCKKYELSHEDCCAIGDGANDLAMLEAAGFGVGYRPKKLLRDRLKNVILYSNLTALLYAQGYRQEDIQFA